MSDPRVSVLLPSFRPEGLGMVGSCLARQSLSDFEWLVCMPEALAGRVQPDDHRVRMLTDPPGQVGDFYALTRAWNHLARQAKGQLLVYAVDYIWFGPDALNLFWEAYQALPRALVSSVGRHYRSVVAGRPEWLWQDDTRLSYYADRLTDPAVTDIEIDPGDFEMAFASVPRAVWSGAGGFDESYDRGAGWGEKEFACRAAVQMGSPVFLDLAIEIRNYTHPRGYRGDWDQAAAWARLAYLEHRKALEAGTRRWEPCC